MAISTSSTNSNYQNNLNFKKQQNIKIVDYKKYPNYEVKKYEMEGSTSKKWGVGIASWLLTGLGQVINGDWGKGIGMFLGNITLPFLGGFLIAHSTLAQQVQRPKSSKISLLLGIGGILAGLGTKIWSIVDAVKNAKTEVTQITPVNEQNNGTNEVR